ncbi:hypothetical protein MWN63_15635 [Paradonghicola geojensis]|nr:hypothetical protein [Marivivens geojensis]
MEDFLVKVSKLNVFPLLVIGAAGLCSGAAVLAEGAAAKALGLATIEAVPLTESGILNAMTEGSKYSTDRPIGYAIAALEGDFPQNLQLEQASLDAILSEVASYTKLNFVDLGIFESYEEARNSGATIILFSDQSESAFDPDDDVDTGAAGFYPDAPENEGTLLNGFIVINENAWGGVNGEPPVPGTFSYLARIHELGHVFGLKHPHDDAGTERPTFEEVNAGGLDDRAYTVMSYENFEFVSAEDTPSVDPLTYMPLDILSLMYLYGINETHNSNDNIHTINTNDGRKAIYDSGGSDTVDAYSVSTDLKISLPWSYPISLVDVPLGSVKSLSELDQPFITWLLGDYENVVSGSGDDQIQGNKNDNILNGGPGDDTIDCFEGNDIMIGGDGADIFIFRDVPGANVIVDYELGIDKVVFTGPGGLDDGTPAPEIEFEITNDGDTLIRSASGLQVTIEGIDASVFREDFKR